MYCQNVSLQSYVRGQILTIFSMFSRKRRVIGNSIFQSNNVYDGNSFSKCTLLLYSARVNSTRTTTSAKLWHVGIVADCRHRQSNKTEVISRFRSDQCVYNNLLYFGFTYNLNIIYYIWYMMGVYNTSLRYSLCSPRLLIWK